jgi:hypothetical protein
MLAKPKGEPISHAAGFKHDVFGLQPDKGRNYTERGGSQVWAFTFQDSRSQSASRRDAFDAANKPMQSIPLIKWLTKLDPSCALQKAWHVALLGPLAARQDYWQNAESSFAWVDAPLDGQAHFLVMPWTETMRTKEDDLGIALNKSFFDGGLPRITWNKVPLVQPAG